jgi:hypothetical protein
MKTYFGDGDLVPAFTIADCETDPPSWAVNLNDFRLGEDGAKVVLQVFHKLDEAQRFVAEHKGKKQ